MALQSCGYTNGVQFFWNSEFNFLFLKSMKRMTLKLYGIPVFDVSKTCIANFNIGAQQPPHNGQCDRVVTVVDSIPIRFCPQGVKSPRCRITYLILLCLLRSKRFLASSS